LEKIKPNCSNESNSTSEGGTTVESSTILCNASGSIPGNSEADTISNLIKKIEKSNPGLSAKNTPAEDAAEAAAKLEKAKEAEKLAKE